MKRLAGLIPAAALVFTVACGQTDAGITTSVKSKLAADEAVKAYQIDVDTKEHVVTLSGRVDSAVARDRAMMLARQTDGVRDVIDDLAVADTAATSGRIDAESDVDAAADTAKRKTDEGADAAADAARKTGNAAKEGAKDVADGAKEGAKAIGKGAKKIGEGIKDAVTDDDPDSDKDGK